MSIFPKDLKYTASHLWVYIEEDGIATIGVTDYGQDAIGDIIFVDLPIDGDELVKGEHFGILESVELTFSLIAPLSGIVLEVNPDIDSNPELINESPYESGWLIRMEPLNLKEMVELLSAEAYELIC